MNLAKQQNKKSIFRNRRHFYTNNKISGTKVRKKVPFTIATIKIKYLGINSTKDSKDLYSENYTTQKK